MSLYDQIISGKTPVAVIGLGYVGLPLAVEFSKKSKSSGLILINQKFLHTKMGLMLRKK